MFDWFDEPLIYYRRFAPMRSGVFDHLSRWMSSVDREMEKQFGEFYDPFYPRKHKPALSHSSTNKGKKRTPKPPPPPPPPENEYEEEEEETKKDDIGLPTQYYTISSSMYSGSDGVQHVYREEQDSRSGQKKVVETRRIGNKSLTLHRVTDKDGNTEEHETRKNIKDEEVDSFKKLWEEKNVHPNQPPIQQQEEEPKPIEPPKDQ